MKKAIFFQMLLNGVVLLFLSAGCAATSVQNPLTGHRWILEDAPARAELIFTVDGKRVVGSSGVNRFFAPVKHGAGGVLEIDLIARTRKAGSPAEMKYEREFFRRLGAVRFTRIENGRLLLLDAEGKTLLRFRVETARARP